MKYPFWNKKVPWLIVLIPFVSIIVYWSYEDYRIGKDIETHKRFTVGRVLKVRKAFRSTGHYVDYYFIVDGKRYREDVAVNFKEQCLVALIDKDLPVVYSSINPNHNRLLLTTEDFERFDPPYPNSFAKCD